MSRIRLTLRSAGVRGARALTRARGALRRVASRRRVAGEGVDEPSLGVIDRPVPGLVVSPRLLKVKGWVLPVDAPVARIHVRVDGHDVGLARQFSEMRPDIAHRFPAASSAPLAAYECWARVSGTPGARVRIEVEVEDLDGAFRSLEPSEITIGVEDHEDEPAPAGPALVRVPTASSELARRVGRSSSARLAVFTHRLDLGGAQLYLRELLEQLLADPATSCLVISASDGPLRAQLEGLGAEVLIGDFPVDTIDAYEAAIAGFATAIQGHGADVVLVHTLLAGLGAEVARRLRIPTIWLIRETLTLDEFWLSAYGEDGIAPEVRATLTRALAHADAAVFETHATQATLADACAPEHSVVIAHDLRLERIDEFRDQVTQAEARWQIGIDDDRFVVLNVGSVEPHKGQAALVFAFAHLADEHPHASLVVVGDAGNAYAQAVRHSIDRLGLGDRIRMQATVADPLPWYRAADAFVLPSDQENLPRTLLEAMTFELPSAATTVGGIHELVVHGRNGLLFPPRDLGALVEVLRELLRLSAEERATLGIIAARDVRARQHASAEIDTFRSLITTLSTGAAGDAPG